MATSAWVLLLTKLAVIAMASLPRITLREKSALGRMDISYQRRCVFLLEKHIRIPLSPTFRAQRKKNRLKQSTAIYDLSVFGLKRASGNSTHGHLWFTC